MAKRKGIRRPQDAHSTREARWKRFHSWESHYERERVRKLSPVERIRLYEDLYQTVLRVRPEGIRCRWASDEAGKEDPHIKHLIEIGRALRRSNPR